MTSGYRAGTLPTVTEQPQPAVAVASGRTPGFDVSRALAVFGMMIVNFEAKTNASVAGLGWLEWLSNRLEGRAAALFVILAGVGISLRSRKTIGGAPKELGFERRALLKRALILYLAGLLNLHLWDWDILHFYGVYLAVGALLLAAPSAALWVCAGICVLVQIGLGLRLNYDQEFDQWTPTGAVWDMIFGGLHPVFPWLAFLLIGMWLGRQDLRQTAVRRRILIAALCVMGAGELLDTGAGRFPGVLALSPQLRPWLSSWPRPPYPNFVISAGATAITIICIVIGATQSRAGSRWVLALSATGQLALTLYVGHAIAILVPLQHGLLYEASLATIWIYTLVLYTIAVAAAWWWRRRYAQGPLEGFIRQVTGRVSAAPWGGALIVEPRPTSKSD